MKTKITGSDGFTLIELLVAIFILAFVAVFTSKSLQSSIRFQNKYQKNLDQEGRLRSGLSVMERDINMAFHTQSIEQYMNQQIAAGSKTPPAGQQVPPGPFGLPQPITSAANTPQKPNWTQFWGDEDKLYFTSRSNVRFNSDSNESDLMKVGYVLKSCGGALGSGPTKTLNCVWRITSPVIVDPIDQGGTEQVLIENVKEFKMRYIGVGKEDWDSKWYTDTRGDTNSFDKFPIAVQIHVATEEDRNGKPRESVQDTIAMIRFPNNESPADANQQTPTPGAPTKPGGVPPTKPGG